MSYDSIQSAALSGAVFSLFCCLLILCKCAVGNHRVCVGLPTEPALRARSHMCGVFG